MNKQNCRVKFYYVTFVTILILSRCGNSNHNLDNITQGFLDSLTERQILNYTISIPRDYSIKENQGPDFTVFYFSPTDTTIKGKFSGGMYFGNYPSQFPPRNDSCMAETLDSKIFDNNSVWTIYICQGKYSVQTMVDNKDSAGWNNQVHAFGHGRSKGELYQILKIYSTIHKKK